MERTVVGGGGLAVESFIISVVTSSVVLFVVSDVLLLVSLILLVTAIINLGFLRSLQLLVSQDKRVRFCCPFTLLSWLCWWFYQS